MELCADYALRLQRNRTENRLLHKPSKRNLEKSEERFRYLEGKYRLNSHDGELTMENYIKIDNTDLSPETVAEMIQQRFQL